MQFGIQNEINFTKILNGKRISDLDSNMQQLIQSIFEDVDNESTIECWSSHYLEKADIKIRINGAIKGISIKTGRQCSMHQESFDKFSKYLIKLGLDQKFINILHNFITGKVNGERTTSKVYIDNNPKDIEYIRDKLNDYYIKINLILRFIIQGTEIQNYDCSAIIHGTPDSFLWATKNEIVKFLINYKIKEYNYINISALNLKCYNRNLRNNKKRLKNQEDIQIKWYSIVEDFLYITKMREATNIYKKIKN